MSQITNIRDTINILKENEDLFSDVEKELNENITQLGLQCLTNTFNVLSDLANRGESLSAAIAEADLQFKCLEWQLEAKAKFELSIYFKANKLSKGDISFISSDGKKIFCSSFILKMYSKELCKEAVHYSNLNAKCLEAFLGYFHGIDTFGGLSLQELMQTLRSVESSYEEISAFINAEILKRFERDLTKEVICLSVQTRFFKFVAHRVLKTPKDYLSLDLPEDLFIYFLRKSYKKQLINEEDIITLALQSQGPRRRLMTDFLDDCSPSFTLSSETICKYLALIKGSRQVNVNQCYKILTSIHPLRASAFYFELQGTYLARAGLDEKAIAAFHCAASMNRSEYANLQLLILTNSEDGVVSNTIVNRLEELLKQVKNPFKKVIEGALVTFYTVLEFPEAQDFNDPKCRSHILAKGYQAALNNDPKEALERFVEALEIQEHDWRTAEAAGNACVSLEYYEDALKFYKLAIFVKSKNVTALERRIFDVYVKMQNLPEMIARARKHLEENNNPEWLIELLHSAVLKDDHEQIEVVWNSFNQFLHASPLYSIEKGKIHIVNGEYEEALESFDHAEKLSGAENLYFYDQAFAKYELGYYEEALTLLQKIEIFYQPKAEILKLCIYSNLNQFERCIQQALNLIGLSIFDDELLLVGLKACKISNWYVDPRAIALVKHIKNLSHPLVLFVRAYMHKTENHRELAIETFRQVLYTDAPAWLKRDTRIQLSSLGAGSKLKTLPLLFKGGTWVR